MVSKTSRRLSNATRRSALSRLAPPVRHHHERLDGGGYPDGIQGEATPLLARVLALADAYASMVAGWPGRAAQPPAEARAALKAGAGTQFDGELVSLLLASWKKPGLRSSVRPCRQAHGPIRRQPRSSATA